VVLDDGIFDEVFLHPNWPEDQIQRRYVAEVGGFNLNANVLEFAVRPTAPGQVATYETNPPNTRYVNVRNSCVTGNRNAIWLSRYINTNDIVLKGETPSRAQVPVAVTVHDPSMYAATVFAEVLARKGITVSGTVRRDRTLSATRRANGPAADRWRVLAIHETPLATVIARANKDSVNLYAESLCKRLGFETTGLPGSWASGTAALGAFLTSVGVAPGEFKLDDGSGLSKHNAISAEAMARILAFNFHSPNREVFRGSLAVAGVDGTLDRRFRGSDLRGRVFAKSGFVNGVCALSGYVKTRDEQWYAFSILMNRVSSLGEMQQIQERVVKAIDTNAATFADGR
jgi:D-alanyl-D-alanine carboxypeptidase/D-alanyl-D-alanine-endopeptidase (penicillin-binding protein 4)